MHTRVLDDAPLDVLLYCHDGCGYGHASRTVAIALGLRRIAPDARVLLVTGSSAVSELTAGAELDWVKLPSYRSATRDGNTVGLRGFSGFEPPQLAQLRAALLEDLVRVMRPRVLFVDHMPAGKKNELLPALEEMRRQGGQCVLGLRAIVGDNDAFWSDAAVEVVRRHYATCLWFGEERVHGMTELDRIRRSYACVHVPIGFVSRARELDRRGLIPQSNAYGTVAFSWCDGETAAIADSVASAVAATVAPAPWSAYIGPARGGAERSAIAARFAEVPAFRVEEFHRSYLAAVRASRVAVTYAGYNTMTDLLWARTPAVVITRATVDSEQQLHASCLARVFRSAAVFLHEDVNAGTVRRALERHLAEEPSFPEIDLDGSTRAAEVLRAMS